jgi:hypothetical protein
MIAACTYDAWKATEPAPEHPDPPDLHEECERREETLTAEIAQLHRRIEELEIELAARKERRL